MWFRILPDTMMILGWVAIFWDLTSKILFSKKAKEETTKVKRVAVKTATTTKKVATSTAKKTTTTRKKTTTKKVEK
jgi:hypothetical protein